MKKQITKGKVIQSCIAVVAAVVIAGGVGFQFHEIQELNEKLTVLTDKQIKTVQVLEEVSNENAQIQDQYTTLASEADKLTTQVTDLTDTKKALEKERDTLKKDKQALQQSKDELQSKNGELAKELQVEKERPRTVTTSSAATSKKTSSAVAKTASNPTKAPAQPSPKPTAKTTVAATPKPPEPKKEAAPAPVVKQAAAPKTESVGQVLSGSATAYNANCEGCSGITASGKTVGPGMVAMASWVPLGTKVRITCDSYPSINGVYTVEDRGGAIQGNKVDIFMSSHSQAIDFGRRTIQIEILN